MVFLITSTEFELLQGLPSLHWQIYIILRKEMDIKTGFSGKAFPISLRGLANSCYIEPGQGKQCTGSPSVGKIRIALASLMKVGLIESNSITSASKKQLIYYLPIAFRYLSHPKKHSSFQAHKGNTQDTREDPKDKSVESVSYNRFTRKGSREVGTAPNLKHCTHQENKNNIKKTNIAAATSLSSDVTPSRPIGAAFQPAATAQHPIPFSFVPNEQVIAQAKTMGLPNAEDPKTLLEFVTHAKAHGKSYHDWDAAFLQWLIHGERLLKQQEAKCQQKDNRNAKSSKNRSASTHGSLVERITKNNQHSDSVSNVLLFSASQQTGHPDTMDKYDDGIW